MSENLRRDFLTHTVCALEIFYPPDYFELMGQIFQTNVSRYQDYFQNKWNSHSLSSWLFGLNILNMMAEDRHSRRRNATCRKGHELLPSLGGRLIGRPTNERLLLADLYFQFRISVSVRLCYERNRYSFSDSS